ncbi:MAG TPA: AzlD domain-containing protein [Anaerolineaceae bacterium]|nr:AzlD domain-containing protein [Anaerolineaceae bacterium]HPN50699.1 AzlD domain-containing protein [Anaerolineaceae bacterium]
MEIWLIIIGAGLVTFLTRLSFIALQGRWQPPELLQRGLRFVPPAVLTAIILPELLMPGGQLHLGLDNLRLLAGLAAAATAWRTRSVLWAIAVGMGSLYLLQAVSGWLAR